MAMNTGRTGAHASTAALGQSLGGHHSRSGGASGQAGGAPQGNPLLSASQSVTAIGEAVHQTGHGGAPMAAPQATSRLLFFTFLTTFANVPTPQVC